MCLDVRHNPEMNTKILMFIAANFPNVVMKVIADANGTECVSLIGIEGKEGKKYCTSGTHIIHMDYSEQWAIVHLDSGWVAQIGASIQDLITKLKQYKAQWACIDSISRQEEAAGF